MSAILRLLSTAALAAAPALSFAAPLANGSLESSAAGYIETVSANTTANGWTVSGANIEYVKAGYSGAGDTVGAAMEGLWFVDLNGTQGPGTISQTFDTIAGQWYRVDYWMSGNAGPNGSTSADGAKSLVALWNGATADAATYLHQSGDRWSNLRWEGHSFLVQASATSSTLGFRSTSTVYAAAGPFIDAISVTAVPEPAEAAMWLAGIGMLAAVSRRRRAPGDRPAA
jgi:MYXO-CTERM domain-containing protein